MKKILFILIIIITAWSCGDDNDDNLVIKTNVNATFKFTHNWDGTNVTNADFYAVQYTNANGEQMSIEKLRYLISNITFHHENGTEYVIDGHNLVDVTTNTNTTYDPAFQLPKGTYTDVTFTFGFNNDDNYGVNYPDLNTALWNVPEMMGGGYHYMQLEGKFINSLAVETGYAYHTIRAVDMSNAPDLLFQDTFFDVSLGSLTITNNVDIEIQMNIAEWFKNPNQWDLNVLNNMMMPNFNAQVMMYDNGQTVFSRGSITQ